SRGHRQPNAAPQALLFAASVAIRFSTGGKGVSPPAPGGCPFSQKRKQGSRSSGLEKASDSRLLSKRIGRFTRRVRPPHISISCCQSRLLRAKRETSRAVTAPTLPRHTSATIA